MLSPDITPSQLRTLDRESVLYTIAHEILHRLIKIEPDSLRIDEEGEPSIFTVTDEGNFLASLMDTIDKMRINYVEKN